MNSVAKTVRLPLLMKVATNPGMVPTTPPGEEILGFQSDFSFSELHNLLLHETPQHHLLPPSETES
jgi:hypothetical protein